MKVLFVIRFYIGAHIRIDCLYSALRANVVARLSQTMEVLGAPHQAIAARLKELFDIKSKREGYHALLQLRPAPCVPWIGTP